MARSIELLATRGLHVVCILLTAILSSFLLAGCAGTSSETAKTTKIQLLWPEPPDAPRFIYETSLSSAADIVKETDEERTARTFISGLPGISTEPVYDKPSAVAARGGRVYVADPASRAVIVFDAGRRRLFKFGHREPSLNKPVSMAIDAKGQVYVLDGTKKRVQVYDPLGLFLFALGEPKDFTRPVGVAVSPDGERIYVVDRGGDDKDDHKVIAYAPDGNERFRIGGRGNENGKFNIPLAAAAGADGLLYVVDTGNFRIQVFDENGRFKLAFGGVGVNLGKFSRARSIALDTEGNVYVSDGGFNNVQIFNSAGQLLMPLGRTTRVPGPAHFTLIAGIAVDETNRLYVTDHYFKKIDVFRRLSEEEGNRLAVK
jgi:DNA-binding beta-propeller fold protein YncE